jgi:hypothetical protein
MKLKTLVESFKREEEVAPLSLEEKKEVLSMIGEYNEMGKALDRNGNLSEVAEKLSKIAESAKSITLAENDGNFNQKVIKENMGQLGKAASQFNQIAQESTLLEQQLVALYEDCGHILERYFQINECIEEVTDLSDL